MCRRLAELAALLMVGGLCLCGCARGGAGNNTGVPEAVIDVSMRVVGTIRDNFYYFVAFNAGTDSGQDYPVPVAAGPYWGNGWGTGAITHFLEYHNGQYNVFAANLNLALQSASGGFLSVNNTIAGHEAGTLRLVVSSVSPGVTTVSGAGAVSAVSNTADFNAGSITFTTDAGGLTVAGSVSFTPASDGSRALNGGEQAQLNALNAGGASINASALSAFGLQLTINIGSLAGTQSIAIGQATANVNWTFTAQSTGTQTIGTATLNMNSSTPTANPPLPGLRVTAGELTVGDAASILMQFSENSTLIGPPFDSVSPANTNQLKATIDLAMLGGNTVSNLSINFITTTELIFDPTMVDPRQHVYDGLGPLGNDAIRIYDPFQFLTISNADAFVKEQAGDLTLNGPATQQEKDAVDIIDWTVSSRRLR